MCMLDDDMRWWKVLSETSAVRDVMWWEEENIELIPSQVHKSLLGLDNNFLFFGLLGLASSMAEPLFCQCLQASSRLSAMSLNGRHRLTSGRGILLPCRYSTNTVSINATICRGRSLPNNEAGGPRQLRRRAAGLVAFNLTRIASRAQAELDLHFLAVSKV